MEFVRSEQNLADIFTKNVTKAVMDMHQRKLIGRRPLQPGDIIEAESRKGVKYQNKSDSSSTDDGRTDEYE